MATVKVRIRNISFAPELSDEGVYLCPLPSPPPVQDGALWYEGLTPHERLYYHQTLNSVRQSKRFMSSPDVPKDSLDFQLQSRYDHSREMFPEKVDSLLQRETCPGLGPDGKPAQTFRVLRNVKTVQVLAADTLDHPLKIAGIKEKISPHSVKLINSGVHNQLVNNGFSRQKGDGNFFRY